MLIFKKRLELLHHFNGDRWVELNGQVRGIVREHVAVGDVQTVGRVNPDALGLLATNLLGRDHVPPPASARRRRLVHTGLPRKPEGPDPVRQSLDGDLPLRSAVLRGQANRMGRATKAPHEFTHLRGERGRRVREPDEIVLPVENASVGVEQPLKKRRAVLNGSEHVSPGYSLIRPEDIP